MTQKVRSSTKWHESLNPFHKKIVPFKSPAREFRSIEKSLFGKYLSSFTIDNVNVSNFPFSSQFVKPVVKDSLMGLFVFVLNPFSNQKSSNFPLKQSLKKNCKIKTSRFRNWDLIIGSGNWSNMKYYMNLIIIS